MREKAKQLVELLNDTSRIREEREKARALRDKYVGIAGEDRFGGASFAHVYCLPRSFPPSRVLKKGASVCMDRPTPNHSCTSSLPPVFVCATVHVRSSP